MTQREVFDNTKSREVELKKGIDRKSVSKYCRKAF